MTKNGYRIVVVIQVVAAVVLAGITIGTIRKGLPEMRVRMLYRSALRDQAIGSEASLRSAVQILDQVLAIRPDLPEALAFEGRVLLELGDLERAGRAYKHLDEVAVKHPEWAGTAANGLGCIGVYDAVKRSDRQLLDEADQFFQTCIEKNPKDADTQVNAAVCKLYLNDLAGAADHLAAARQAKIMSRNSLATYYAAIGSTLGQAAVTQPAAAQPIIDSLTDNEDLTNSTQLLRRSIDELAKAIELARGTPQEKELVAQQIIAKARLLGSAGVQEVEAVRYRSEVVEYVSSPRCPAPSKPWLRLMVEASRPIGNYMDANAIVVSLPETAPAELHFYAGSVLFRLLQFPATSPRQKTECVAQEEQAAKQLNLALRGAALAPHERFLALYQLGIISEHAGKPADALTNLQKAQRVMASLPAGKVSREDRALFLQNMSMVLWENGRVGEAVAALRASNTGTAKQLVEKILQLPAVEQLEMTSLESMQVPPSRQVFSVTVRATGPVPVRREDISFQVDGRDAPFIVGPSGRIYAFPKEFLAEGEHPVVVSVKGPSGQPPVVLKQSFKVDYKANK